MHRLLGGKSAGNGSLMRCLPIALAYPNKSKMEELTKLQSKMTHYDDLAIEACLIYNRIAFRILQGEELKQAVFHEIKGTRYQDVVATEPNIPPDGFVANTFIWVLYILLTRIPFEEVVQTAANNGGDSDTIGAIAGGLAGLAYGYEILPNRYKEIILLKSELEELAQDLVDVRRRL